MVVVVVVVAVAVAVVGDASEVPIYHPRRWFPQFEAHFSQCMDPPGLLCFLNSP